MTTPQQQPETPVAEPEERIGKYRVHPVASLFPLLEGEEFDALVEDIGANGLHEPIWLHPVDGSILDGRNRYRACLEAEVEPRFRAWSGKGSLIAFVISANLRRRHLTKSQRALLAARMAQIPEVQEEAYQRRIANLQKGQELPVTPLMEGREKGETAEHTARLVGIGKSYVYYAEKLITTAETDEAARALLVEIDTGRATLTQARRMLQQRDAVTKANELCESHAAQWPNRERNSHTLPLEALWLSPRQKLLDLVSRYPDSLKRSFREFRKWNAVSRFDDPAQFPDRVTAGAHEMDRVFDECLEMLLSASDIFADQCLAAVEEASDVPIPSGKREHHAALLKTNQWQKNYEGWCAELGCWAVIDVKAAEQSGSNCGEVYCTEHAKLRAA